MTLWCKLNKSKRYKDYMVTKNMLRTHEENKEFKEEKNRISTGLELIKCLKQITPYVRTYFWVTNGGPSFSLTHSKMNL